MSLDLGPLAVLVLTTGIAAIAAVAAVKSPAKAPAAVRGGKPTGARRSPRR